MFLISWQTYKGWLIHLGGLTEAQADKKVRKIYEAQFGETIEQTEEKNRNKPFQSFFGIEKA